MCMNKVTFQKPPSEVELAKVEVHDYDGCVFPRFFDWVDQQVRAAARALGRIRSSKSDQLLKFNRSREVLRFSVVHKHWVTFGYLRLSFYSYRKEQVRATVSFCHELRNDSFMAPHDEISFLLDELPVVLPALLASFSEMNYKPIRDLGIFKFDSRGHLPESPGEGGGYVWTIRGIEGVPF